MSKSVSKAEAGVEGTLEERWLTKGGNRFPRLAQEIHKLFSIDLRTLALTRITLALIVLVDLVIRSADLTAFYSDDGVLPRAALQGTLARSWSVSLYALNGRPGVAALLFLISGVCAFLLLAGYKTSLAAFFCWLLFSSLCTRNTFIVHGADSLLRMLLFWGIFVPWGALYSVDRALDPSPRKLPTSVLSIGTVALLLQMPMVYFFGGLLKNGLEWRHDLTAIAYTLKAPDYALPLGVWLSGSHGLLKALTATTLVLEIAGAILLFCPFRTRTVRFVVVVAFFFLQLGLSLTLNLGLFPLVSLAALIPFISSYFWDRLFSRLQKPERSGLRIYYDSACGFCTKGVRLIKTFFLLPETRTMPAQETQAIMDEMVMHNSWIVIDHEQTKHFRFDALIEVFRVSPILWPIAPFMRLRAVRSIGNWVYELVANNRGILTPLTAGLRYRLRTIRQPLWVSLVCAACLTYVIVDNLGSVARSPIRIPGSGAVVGQFLNIHQRWRMFAPRPLIVYSRYVVIGRLEDGTEVDLWSGGQADWAEPKDYLPWVKNYRWRTYFRYLAGNEYQALRPYFAGYVCRSWNSRHPGKEKVRVIWIYALDEPISLDGSGVNESKRLLWQGECSVSGKRDSSEASR